MTNLVSLQLPAGDWDVSAAPFFRLTTSGNFDLAAQIVSDGVVVPGTMFRTTTAYNQFNFQTPIPIGRVTNAQQATLALQASSGGGGASGTGFLRARRWPAGVVGTAALDYSTTEQATGRRWIDGKMIYEKVVALYPPVAGIVATPHGITNMDRLADLIVILFYSPDGTVIKLPYLNPYNATTIQVLTGNMVGAYANRTNVFVTCGVDQSVYVGHAILQYTCTDR